MVSRVVVFLIQLLEIKKRENKKKKREKKKKKRERRMVSVFT